MGFRGLGVNGPSPESNRGVVRVQGALWALAVFEGVCDYPSWIVGFWLSGFGEFGWDVRVSSYWRRCVGVAGLFKP